MSYYGQWIAATIEEGNSESSAINLGRRYDFLSMRIPALDSCKLHLKVAETAGGTYFDLDKDAMEVPDTFDRADVFRLGGWQFVKVVSSRAQLAQRLIRVSGMSY